MQDKTTKKKHSEKTKKHTLTRLENFLGASNVKKTQKIVHPKSNLKNEIILYMDTRKQIQNILKQKYETHVITFNLLEV